MFTRLLAPLSAFLLLAGAASAADLGGNCCTDLEERVAELEATAARKGNRKMQLTIYGQVDKMYLWENSSVGALGGFKGLSPPSQHGVTDNANAPTLIGATGEAKVSDNLKVGFRVEIQVGNQQTFTTAQFDGNGQFEPAVTQRVAVAWVDTAVGKVTVGHGSVASDGTGQVTVANTAVASRLLSMGPAAVTFLGFDTQFIDVRRDNLRYDSPTFLGFIVSGSVENGDSPSPFLTPFLTIAPGGQLQSKQAWDIALRYANEIKVVGGIRVAAAISYRSENGALFTPFPADNVIQGSVSAKSMATGIFASFAMGEVNGIGSGFLTPALQLDERMWHVQAGWENRIFAWGQTTLFGEYAQLSFSGSPGTASKASFSASQDTNIYGLGAVQAIDAAATDLYFGWKHYDVGSVSSQTNPHPSIDLTPTVTSDVIMGGARVKF